MTRPIHKLPWILLAISLAFNLSFWGGFLRARSGWPGEAEADGVTAKVARELELSEPQRESFAQARREWLAVSGELRQAIYLARQELWGLLEDPAANEPAIQAAKQRLGELHDELQQLRVEHFRRFMRTLEPQQRRQLIGRLRRSPRADRAHRRVLERFDADGDGVLSPSERDKAREHFLRRHEEGRRPPRLADPCDTHEKGHHPPPEGDVQILQPPVGA